MLTWIVCARLHPAVRSPAVPDPVVPIRGPTPRSGAARPEPPVRERAGVRRERVHGPARPEGERRRPRGQRGEHAPRGSRAGQRRTVAAVQDHAGRLPRAERRGAELRRPDAQRSRQGPGPAAAVRPGRHQAGIRAGPGAQQRHDAAAGHGEPDHVDLLPGHRPGHGRARRLPGAAMVREDARDPGPAAVRGQHRDSGPAERGCGQATHAAGFTRRGGGQRRCAGQAGPGGPAARSELRRPAAGQRDEAAAGAAGQSIGRVGETGGHRARRRPAGAAVAGGRERREREILAGPEPGHQRPAGADVETAGAGDVETAVVGYPGRGRQPPPRRSGRPHEQLPEVVLLGRRAAHLHDRPAGPCGAGEGRSQRGCGRNRRRARVRRRFGAAARGQHAGRRGHDAGRGALGAGSSPAGRVHDCFETCWAALVSSAANDDSVLAVPGPGSKLSSVRVFPPASITKATSLWPIIPPAGRTCVPMA